MCMWLVVLNCPAPPTHWQNTNKNIAEIAPPPLKTTYEQQDTNLTFFSIVHPTSISSFLMKYVNR